MALAPWSIFLPEVTIDVAGCPQPVLINAVKRAAARFIRDSKILKATLNPITLVAGTGHYALAAPEGLQLVGAAVVTANGEALRPTSKVLSPQWETETGAMSHYIQEDPYAIDIVRIPDLDVADGLVVESHVTPDPAVATGVEEWLAEAYTDEIAAGAKARLMMMRGRPWSDPALAAYHEQAFVRGIGDAAVVKVTGANDAPLRTRSYYR